MNTHKETALYFISEIVFVLDKTDNYRIYRAIVRSFEYKEEQLKEDFILQYPVYQVETPDGQQFNVDYGYIADTYEHAKWIQRKLINQQATGREG